MKLRKLGSSELNVSPVAIGCWSFGGNDGDYWGKQEQSDVDATVKGAIDKGINFFDTALGYNSGRSEMALGKALKGIREKAVVCDKIPPNFEPDQYEDTVNKMLNYLDMDYMDLLLLHWPTSTNDGNRGRMEAMVKLMEKGKVKSIGVSNFGVGQLEGIKEFLPYVSANEMCHSIISRGIEAGITQKCMDSDIGIIGYSPLNQGLLTGKYSSLDEIPPNYTRMRHFNGNRAGSRHGGPGAEDDLMAILKLLKEISDEIKIPQAQIALAWSIATPGITSTIVGSRNEKQLISNSVACGITLPDWVIEKINDASWPMVEKIGWQPDYYQSVEDCRIW